MKQLIRSFITISTKYAHITLILALLVACLCLWHAWMYMEFDTDQDHLISDKQKYYQDYKEFLKEFGDWEYIYVVIKTPPTEMGHKTAKQFANQLYAKLSNKKKLFEEVTHRFDSNQLKDKLLLLSSSKEFADFLNFANANKKHLHTFLNIQDVKSWYAFINNLFNEKMDPQKEAHLEKFWPILKTSMLAPFDLDSLNKLKKMNLLSFLADKSIDPDGYLFSENGKLLFVRILPKKDFSRMDIISEPLQYLRLSLEEFKKQYPELSIGITGRPVLQNDEATSTQVDSQWAGLASFLLVALVILFLFREYKKPLFALLALAIGIAWTTGFVSVFFGKINLITIVFTIILIGLGIDYGIHYLSRYLTEKEQTEDIKTAIENTSTHTGRAILIGAITSATAFATALFTDFLGLQELGVIAGVGIILSCLSALTVFPSLLSLFDKQTTPKTNITHWKTTRFFTKHPKIVVGVFILMTIASIPFVIQIKFDNNLLKLQDQNLESVQYEKIIQDNSDFSTWFLVYQTKDITKLQSLQNKINNLISVKKTQSILDLIPTNQEERLQELKKLRNEIQKITSQTTKNESLVILLERLKKRFEELANQALINGWDEEYDELNSFSDAINPKSQPVFSQDFMMALSIIQNNVSQLLHPKEITEAQLPKNLLSLYKSKNAIYSLTIYPKKDIWIPENLKEFIDDVRSVIPDVTGAPITTYESAKRMAHGFVLVAFLTSLLVLFFVFFEFRNFKAPILIYANLLLCFCWLGALMFVKGIHINLANFFALPILIGTGIDHGIHIFHAYYENRSLDHLYLATIPAVIMSCITTICGFGALSFVRHEGLASFGLIMATGTLLIMLSSVILLPCIIKILFLAKKE